MIRTLILSAFSIFIFLFGWLVNPVEISMFAPGEIVAGVPFEVEISIDKGSIKGFARFQQKLPIGFSAELIDAETGDFKFEEQTVKFFWLIIPVKEVIKLKYRITTDVNISGTYSLGGIFSYIDGDKKYAEMPNFEIVITPSPLASNVQDTAKIQMSSLPQIICKRESVKVNEQGEIIIEIRVNRGELAVDQFAKIQEIVPKGYDAQSIETKGGIFTFQNENAKFLWMTLPREQEFMVSYKLIPDAKTNLAKLDIKGNFSYLVNGQTVELPLENTEKPISQIVEEQLAFRQGDLKVENTDTMPIAENLQEVQEDSQENSNIEATVNSEKPVNTITKIETPSTQVSYRVQIAAGHSKIQPKVYFAKLEVKEPIYTEMIDGWYKYTIGGFDQYLNARNKRNNLWAQTPIKDAFVTAYNSGERITVQEALMISNQTWYQ